MNRPQCLALVSAVLVLLLGPPAFGQENPSDEEAIKVSRQVTERLVAAYNAHDAAAVAAHYAPDAEAIAFLGDQVERLKGRAAYQEFLAQSFSRSPSIKLKSTPESVRMVTPEVYVADGTSEVTGSTAEGPTKWRFITVRKKMDGQWLIVKSYLISPQSSAGDQ